MQNAGTPGGFVMNKKVVFFNILLVIGVLLTACGNSAGPMPRNNQPGNVYEISAGLQATEEPLIPMPTIIINPTPGSGGSVEQIDPSTLLLYVLVGAIIVIALIAVLRR